MFINLQNNKNILPVYPASVQGELRIILQVKDEFLLCFKHLESLRNLWDQQDRIITKEFILDQIKSGECEIEQLENDYNSFREILNIRENHNDALVLELRSRGETAVADSSKRRINSCKTTLFRPCQTNLNDISGVGKDTAFISVLENIATKIDAAQNEIKNNLRPLLEFYKDLFYLQLHFTLVLTQISCYCMPLMTDSISLLDRLFFWTERPEFELIKKSGQICDRLRDIYTRLQRILGRLLDTVLFLQDRIDLQRLLEINFYDKMRQLNQLKENRLEDIHRLRLNLDLYEEENDRLVGTLVKIDPLFVESQAFALFAEHKNMFSNSQNNVSILSTSDKGNARSSDNSSDRSQIEKSDPKKRLNVHITSQHSSNSATNLFSSHNNAIMSRNVSNVFRHPSTVSRSSEKHTSNMINQWRTNAFNLLSKMRKNCSKSESNILEFTDLNAISEYPLLSSNNVLQGAEKYVVKFSENSKVSSDHNQTTDALVVTSEILPKDD